MRLLAVIGALAIVVAVGAAVFFFGGFYSVAATEEIAPVAWVLVHVRQASVDRHATAGPPISLDDTAVLRTGAHAFATHGCLNCHGWRRHAPPSAPPQYHRARWAAPRSMK